jgi:ABC-type multidrug transport system ATPase subunit
LDSVSAANVIAVLQSLARDPNNPTTIIASIHQPSSRLYQSFDTVLLLSEGKPLYFGPGGAAPASYFASKGYPCPEGYNVADHLLEIASMSPAESVGEYQYNPTRPHGPVHSETEEYPLTPMETKPFSSGLGSPTTRMMSIDKEDLESSRMHSLPSNRHRNPHGISRADKTCATTFLTQLEVLSGREWRNLKR